MLELGIDLHDEAVRARLEVLFWQLSQHLLSLGQSVILESGFWLREDRDEKRLGARALGAGVELHYLDVPFEKRWNRVSRRNREPIWCRSPITYDQLAGWDQYFEPPSTSELALFDPPSAIGDAAGDAWPHASEFPPT
jgi:predicted kinase